jgi:hypothetical protein
MFMAAKNIDCFMQNLRKATVPALGAFACK